MSWQEWEMHKNIEYDNTTYGQVRLFSNLLSSLAHMLVEPLSLKNDPNDS